MSDNAIVLKNINKTFRYFEKDYKVFQWLFTKKGYTKEFKVLKNISLEIKKGEVVGILGKNGAGKSTILKIISGIYFPSSGKVEVNGSIASLIELGAGFNNELTGRENLYFKGALLGLTKEYIDDNIDGIVEFADIGDYMDMPLGTYSSGMRARLGFSLAVNADPDILIIDEVFAVGDKNFQTKSRAKTEELLNSGKTVLFVSHSETLISEFCNRIVYLKDGNVAYDGEVKRGLAIYHADNLKLKREPILGYKDYEITDNQLVLRFEYGIGAGNQLVANDELCNFEFEVARFENKEGAFSECGLFANEIEKVTDDLVDVKLNLNDIVGGGNFTVTFKYKSEEIKQAIFVESSYEEEDTNYVLGIKNSKNKFVFALNNIID